MKIHHLNCGTLCPFTGTSIVNKFPILKKWTTLVIHCLLIELDDFLILVDTGLGVKDIKKNDRFFSGLLFNNFAKPLLDINETAYHQIIKLGFNPLDVKHIIATHLDTDHIGGIADFPHAEVHILQDEHRAAFGNKNLKNMTRYLPEQFRHAPKWQTYSTEGEKWRGFNAVKQLKGIPPEILMIPLPGHTNGHAGIVIEQQNTNDFFVGDAYMHRNQLLKKITPPYVSIYNKLLHEDLDLFLSNLDSLSELQDQNSSINIYCSHDRDEYECMCAGTTLRSK